MPRYNEIDLARRVSIQREPNGTNITIANMSTSRFGYTICSKIDMLMYYCISFIIHMLRKCFNLGLLYFR